MTSMQGVLSVIVARMVICRSAARRDRAAMQQPKAQTTPVRWRADRESDLVARRPRWRAPSPCASHRAA